MWWYNEWAKSLVLYRDGRVPCTIDVWDYDSVFFSKNKYHSFSVPNCLVTFLNCVSQILLNVCMELAVVVAHIMNSTKVQNPRQKLYVSSWNMLGAANLQTFSLACTIVSHCGHTLLGGMI